MAGKIYGKIMEGFVNFIFSTYSFGVLIGNYLVCILNRSLINRKIIRRYIL